METKLLYSEPYRELSTENYPLQLGQSKYRPKQLFCKGTLPSADKIGLAMVGTRRPSASAEELCRRLVASLQHTNAVVVSGLAQGIDSYCHRAALDAGIPTIAVLAQGLDAKIEGDRAILAERILNAGGALLSEYEGDTPAYKGNFIARNRIISGLSQTTLVVQSRQKGGALLTAQFCIDEQKPLLACPGSFDCELYSGTNALLDSGRAKPVFVPESLRAAAGFPRLDGASVEQLSSCGISLSESAQKVFKRFNGFCKTFSELQQEFEFKAQELLAILTELEISGLVTSKDNFQFYFNGA
ncbi:MAG: DNA-protecting protein DprA [Fibrobacter sp.]|nr:DNA-protecting protein DprA [Fibrobacter sp.]